MARNNGRKDERRKRQRAVVAGAEVSTYRRQLLKVWD